MRADNTTRVSLFPFLAVLFCTVGVLVLMIVTNALTTAEGVGDSKSKLQSEPVDGGVAAKGLLQSATELEGVTIKTDGSKRAVLKMQPRFFECTAEGLVERLPNLAVAESPLIPLDGPGGLRAFAAELAELVSWHTTFTVANIDLIENPFGQWIGEWFAHRDSQLIVLLVRPDGVATFEYAHQTIQLFNELETGQDRPSVHVGYDAIPAGVNISISGTGTNTRFALDSDNSGQ